MKGIHTYSLVEENELKANKLFTFSGRDKNGNAFFTHNNLEKLLSEKELAVLKYRKKSDKEIASLLSISVLTVRSYRNKIFDKIGSGVVFFEGKKIQRGGPGRNQGRKSLFREETKGVKFTCPVSKVEELKKAVKKMFEKWVREGV